MSYQFKKGEHVSTGVRRIVCARIDDALKLLTRPSRSTRAKMPPVTDRTVHEVRKRLKEIRAALRMVRSELGGKTFRKENQAFRNAGRPLSALRDAKILVDSIDGLVEHFHSRLSADRFVAIKRILQARRRAVADEVASQSMLVPSIVQDLRDARDRVKSWPLKKRGWSAIRAGVNRVYSKGAASMQHARANAHDDEALHEWRKRAKDLRYELELLAPIWPEMFQPLTTATHHLTDLLGDDHDLAVLRVIAASDVSLADPAAAADLNMLQALIDERRADMQREAFELGAKLYEETPPVFLARVHGYWKSARQSR